MKSQELYPPEIWVKWHDEDGYYEAWDKTSFPTILNAVRYDRSESATTIDSMSEELNIHDSPIADDWAKEYAKHYKEPDLETMRGWFANAMMAMHDHIKRQEKPTIDSMSDKLDDRIKILCSIGKTIQGISLDDRYEAGNTLAETLNKLQALIENMQKEQRESISTIDSMIAEAKELGYRIWVVPDGEIESVACYRRIKDFRMSQTVRDGCGNNEFYKDQYAAFAAALEAVRKEVKGEK